MVNNPAHYAGADDPYEAIKVEAWGLGFHLGNAVKAIEDLKKAEFYIRREIQKRERT